MRETTRTQPELTEDQQQAADFVGEAYGRYYVRPSRLHHATRCVVLTGLTDDIVRSVWLVNPDGEIMAAANRDRALVRYLATRLHPKLPQIGGQGIDHDHTLPS